MKRRDFLNMMVQTAGAATVIACGSSYEGKRAAKLINEPSVQIPPTPLVTCGPVNGVIVYKNPGHAHTVVSLTASEISAAIPGDYTLMGGGHTHKFRLTAADFQKLKNREFITKQDLEGDGHSIQISC